MRWAICAKRSSDGPATSHVRPAATDFDAFAAADAVIRLGHATAGDTNGHH